jgi:glutathione synthase/RimK-type ligase-like ATP-grasp enzyme
VTRLADRTGHCVALYRKAAYSPQQHLANDAAIMDAVVIELARRGWPIVKSSEDAVERGDLPAADLILNMCQGAAASERLVQACRGGPTVVNRPESVLACHRHALVRQLAGSGIPFPRTLIVPTWLGEGAARALADFLATAERVWVKRGDVHAERPDDVACVRPADVPAALATFGARGITRVAVQEHVPGPVVKFYAIADQSFFRYYGADAGPSAAPPEVDPQRLRTIAFAAAARLNLQVFGGDVVLAAPERPVLVDLNDWPSFAPFRDEAARAIARFVHAQAQAGVAA